MRKIIRWTQVYETVVDLPAECNMKNIGKYSDLFDFDIYVDGSEAQADTYEILSIETPPQS